MQIATRGTVYLQAMFIISSACLLKTYVWEGEIEGEIEKEGGGSCYKFTAFTACVAGLLKLISPDDVMFLISHEREREGGWMI